MPYAIIYPENSDTARFSKLKKRVENDYVPNEAEYPMTVTTLHSLLLNYQPSYNSNINSQYNKVINQLIFTEHGKLGTKKTTEKKIGAETQEKSGSH